MIFSHKTKTCNRKPKTENRKLLRTLLLIGLVTLGGCGSGSLSKSPIVIFCSPDSPRLRQAVAGFKAKLQAGDVEVVCIPEFGAEGRETLRRVRETLSLI